MLIFKMLLGGLASLVGPVFNYLNARVDSNARIHLSDNETLSRVGSTVIAGASKADELNADIRKKEGPFSPTVVAAIAGFLAPFAWHTWQVCLDSSRWLPSYDWVWGFIPYPCVSVHIVGSWRVAALPGMFETTEHAVIQSLFIGASTAATGVALLKALRK
ncbi:hypothetical protein [Bradyrhizobium sp. RT10b]|uniref:hypothetical protein n=1 Tax=Bradyrhizobium sp. RT10b TaxID=3156331 RepID=UPI003393B7CF